MSASRILRLPTEVQSKNVQDWGIGMGLSLQGRNKQVRQQSNSVIRDLHRMDMDMILYLYLSDLHAEKQKPDKVGAMPSLGAMA